MREKRTNRSAKRRPRSPKPKPRQEKKGAEGTAQKPIESRTKVKSDQAKKRKAKVKGQSPTKKTASDTERTSKGGEIRKTEVRGCSEPPEKKSAPLKRGALGRLVSCAGENRLSKLA